MESIILKKILFRFIKEHKLKSCLRDYFFYVGKNHKDFDFSCISFFDKYICWSETAEGYYFWKIVQIKYIITLALLFENNLEEKTLYNDIIKKAIKYINPREYLKGYANIMSKESITSREYYELNFLKKFYIKKFGF